MPRPDDRNRARRGTPRTGEPAKGRGAKGTGRWAAPARDRAMEGGFGPYGAPRPPLRERRPEPSNTRRPTSESRLRMKGERRTGQPPKRRAPGAPDGDQPRRRRGRSAPAGVEAEILRLGGARGPRLLERLLAAAEALEADRDRQALSLARPVREALPDAPSVRELCGVAQYRVGNYRAAAKELEAFVELTDSVEQHPVLMDCYRAQRRWRRVEELWGELAAASPSAELVTEGRIVAAGALADRGELDAALGMLGRKAADVKRARPHHLRLWYALADLQERAGNVAGARDLFRRIEAHDADFADVKARRAALR
jgi:hypothetical protein